MLSPGAAWISTGCDGVPSETGKQEESRKCLKLNETGKFPKILEMSEVEEKRINREGAREKRNGVRILFWSESCSQPVDCCYLLWTKILLLYIKDLNGINK